MVVNIGTKTLAPGQTYVFDSVEGVLKRIYLYVLVGVSFDDTVNDVQLSFTDTFTDYFTFSLSKPVFEMRSEKGTYQGKIFLRNNSIAISHTFTFIEILQP